jgi:hypothetical protein
MEQTKLNTAFDVCSKKPVTKFEMLDFFKSTYDFEYTILPDASITSVTGNKNNYFSESKKTSDIKFKPQYTSLECISLITKQILEKLDVEKC